MTTLFKEKDQEMWREENLDTYINETLPLMVKRKEITPKNIHIYIVPYTGNDFNKLNRDIDRNVNLLKSLNQIIVELVNYDIKFIYIYVKSHLVKQVNHLQELIKNDKFENDPRDFIPIINDDIEFEILFVRHGIACHNVVPADNKKLLNDNSYFDPELTNKGIQRSLELYPVLEEKIKHYYNDQPYSIIASSLMRTQETAYFMLAKHINKEINVAPHIAERSHEYTNFSLHKEEQEKFLDTVDPGINKLLKRGKDNRDIQDIRTKSYHQMFYHWANLNLNFFKKGSDGIYRAVVFTHGGFIDTTFKVAPENNDIVHTIINMKNYKKPSYEYFRVKPMIPEDKECPTGCRITHC